VLAEFPESRSEYWTRSVLRKPELAEKLKLVESDGRHEVPTTKDPAVEPVGHDVLPGPVRVCAPPAEAESNVPSIAVPGPQFVHDVPGALNWNLWSITIV
jgi:hypothetical protein